jgi:predicted transcriptional regulator
MSAVTEVLHALGSADEPVTLDRLARDLHSDPREVIAALSVLECQGLALRARDRYVLSRLGRRTVGQRPAVMA